MLVRLLCFIFILISTNQQGFAFIFSQRTYLAVKNFTPYAMIVNATEVDDFDWDGTDRPDYNFNNILIAPLDEYRKRQEINMYATNCWYRLTFKFSNSDIISVRVNQRSSLRQRTTQIPIFVPIRNRLTTTTTTNRHNRYRYRVVQISGRYRGYYSIVLEITRHKY